jgi:methionyl-tRNA formyltransferase
MRVVFLGTPEFAVPSLRALASYHQVVAVFTQPDRPKGRGNKIIKSPVKIAADALSIAIHQPERIRKPPASELLASFGADLMVVVGYGQIIPQNIIDLPRHGILNVHASLLPKYRGAAPIQWAIANGDRETGVTIMQIDAGLDTGDILLARSLTIDQDKTAPQLSARLASLGAELLIEAISRIEAGTIERQKQDDTKATIAPVLKKEDGLIYWSRSAQEIFNRLRGFAPWPGAYTSFRGNQLLVLRARPSEISGLIPGRMNVSKRNLLVGCGEDTSLELLEVQPAGKGRMVAEAFLNGYRPAENEALGETL